MHFPIAMIGVFERPALVVLKLQKPNKINRQSPAFALLALLIVSHGKAPILAKFRKEASHSAETSAMP